jgi:N-acetylmuramoyl-L-alanine amidase
MPIDQDSLNSKLKNLNSGIDLSSKSSQISDISTKFKAFDLTEMGKNIGEVKGGFEGLTLNVDNAAEATAGELDANGYPTGGVSSATIVKLDKSVQSSVPSLKTNLASHSGDISALVSSSHGTSGEVVSGAAPSAKELAPVSEGLMDDIITDGSPEAIAGTLKTKANVSPQEIKSLLGQVANSAVAGIIDKACGDLLSSKLSGDMGIVLQLASSQLNNALGGLDGGNLLKATVENFTRDIANTITTVVVNLGANSALGQLTALTNLAISGNLKEVANQVVSQIVIPGNLSNELIARGGYIPTFGSPEEMQMFLDGAEGLGLSPEAMDDVASLRVKLNIVNNDILLLDTSLSNSIITTSTSNNPVVDPASYSTGNTSSSTPPPPGSTDGRFPFFNSEEEIVRYLQGATRDITTVVWHWTANYSDQGHVGSEHIEQVHLARGFSRIGYHFVVKRDGSIQKGLDINTVGIHVKGFNTRSIGISFVGGYKCSSSKYGGGEPPYSEIGVESLTQAQHEAFKRFMSAWYKVFPGGQAWGHVDFPNNSGKVDPGFDVDKRCYELFGKRNVGHPVKDGRILTAEEISAKRQFA